MKTPLTPALLLAGLTLLAAAHAHAAGKTWTGAVSTDWFNDLNWSPAGKPVAGDTVLFDNGGTMNITAPLGFSGTFIWVRGTITSSATGLGLATNTVMALRPGNSKILLCPLVNEGTILVQTNSTLYLDNGFGTARLVNYGTLESQSDDSFLHAGTGGGRVENYGLFVKTGGGTTTLSANIPFVNTGTVEARTGTIQIATGTLSGNFIGGGVNHWLGSFTLTNTVNSSNVLINAQLVGTNVTLTGNWTWQTGNWGPGAGYNFTVASNAVLTLIAGNSKILFCPLTNLGTIRLTGPTTLYLDNGFGTARLVNRSVLESTGDDTFTHSGTGNGRVENHALFRKSGGSTTALSAAIQFLNTGTVEAHTGTLQIAAGTLSGHFTGAGLNHWTGSLLLLDSVNSSNVLINAHVFGTNVSLSGNWTWQTGNLGPATGNSFSLSAGALLTLVPGNFKILHCPLTNLGTVRLTGNSTLYLDNGFSSARLVNLGLLDSSGNDTFAHSATGGGVVDNRATFTKSGGIGATAISNNLLFLNTGTVNVLSGSFNPQNGILTATFNGPGKTFLTGNHTLIGDLSAQNLELQSGNFTSSSARLHGAVTWVTGNFFCQTPGAGATVATDGTLTLVPGNSKILFGTLTNLGTMRLTGNSTLYLDNGFGNTRLVNLNLLDSAGDDTFAHSGTGNGVIENRALFRKSAGGGVTTLISTIIFTNAPAATVTVLTGQLNSQNGLLSGTFNGPGKTFLTGNHTLIGDLTAQNLDLQSGNFTVGGARLHGALRWVTGTLLTSPGGLGGTIAADCTLTLVPGNSKVLYAALTNRGALLLTGNTALYLDNGGGHARLANYGLVESLGDDLFSHAGTGGGVLENRGYWRKSAGSTTTINSTLWFVHGGALEAFKGAFAVTGSTFLQQGGTMSFRLNSATDYGQINFTGVAPLGGALAAQVGPGYSPTIGSQFFVVNCQGTNGAFAAYALAPGYTWTVLSTSTFTRLTVTGVIAPGAPTVFTRIEQVAPNIFDLHLLVTPNAPYHMEASNEVGPGASWQYLGPFSSPSSTYVYRHTVLGILPPRQFFRAVSP